MSDLLNNLKRQFYLNSQVMIMDNNQMIIENCRNILECNENLVRIISCDFEIGVWGSELTLSNYSSKTVCVEGKIQSIEITERRKQN